MTAKDIIPNSKSMWEEFGKDPLAGSQEMRDGKLQPHVLRGRNFPFLRNKSKCSMQFPVCGVIIESHKTQAAFLGQSLHQI